MNIKQILRNRDRFRTCSRRPGSARRDRGRIEFPIVAQLRLKEATKAAKILGVSFRDNLKMKDAFFKNDSWQNGRRKAGKEDPYLADLRVHDLRHTVGMRLREANVRENTVADILWHEHRSMTGTTR